MWLTSNASCVEQRYKLSFGELYVIDNRFSSSGNKIISNIQGEKVLGVWAGLAFRSKCSYSKLQTRPWKHVRSRSLSPTLFKERSLVFLLELNLFPAYQMRDKTVAYRCSFYAWGARWGKRASIDRYALNLISLVTNLNVVINLITLLEEPLYFFTTSKTSIYIS